MLKTYRQIIGLLTPAERRHFYALVGLIFAMGIVDVFSVASILPFLAVVANPDVIVRNGMLAKIYSEFGFTERNAFLAFLGATVFCFVVFGIAFRAATFYALTRFTRRQGVSLAIRLLNGYLAQPYGWYLTRHTAQLGRKVLSEVIEVVNGPIAAAMRLMGNIVVAVFLILLLVAVEPLAALAASILIGASYGLIFLFVRSRLNSLGEVRIEANRQRFQIMQEALGGIKEVKLLNLEWVFLRRLHEPAARLAQSQAAMATISEMPRHVLEAAAFGGMLLFVIWLLISGSGDLAAVIPVLGIYALAAVRLFPTIQQVYGGFAALRFGSPALTSLQAELAELGSAQAPDHSQAQPISIRRSLRLDNISLTYPAAGRPALDGLSLTIRANTTVGFVGSTGAGKTTAADVILGLLQPDRGTLHVDGVAIDSSNLGAWQKSVGYVPQTIFLTDDTLAANIAFGIESKAVDPAALERAVRIARLDDLVRSLPNGYMTMVGERGTRLSGGQRQRIGIARALYRDPDILVFDEATSALDNLTERAVMDAVKDLGHQKTIILIAHRLSTVRHCDEIFLFENGRLAACGTYDELVETNSEFRAMHEATL